MIKKLKYPRGITLTAATLNVANSLLPAGRKNADTVVVMFTDGLPTRRLETVRAAKKLRKKARLIFVVVNRGNRVTKFLKQCASKPAKENMLWIRRFWQLSKARTINKVMTNMCPRISTEKALK